MHSRVAFANPLSRIVIEAIEVAGDVVQEVVTLANVLELLFDFRQVAQLASVKAIDDIHVLGVESLSTCSMLEAIRKTRPCMAKDEAKRTLLLRRHILKRIRN